MGICFSVIQLFPILSSYLKELIPEHFLWKQEKTVGIYFQEIKNIIIYGVKKSVKRI